MNKMDLPIDEYNRQFEAKCKNTIADILLSLKSTCLICGRYYIAFCPCDEKAKEVFLTALKFRNLLIVSENYDNPQAPKGSMMSYLRTRIGSDSTWDFNSFSTPNVAYSIKLQNCSDEELEFEHTHWQRIYNRAGNTEQETHKANEANWYATLCLTEKIRRKNNSSAK